LVSNREQKKKEGEGAKRAGEGVGVAGGSNNKEGGGEVRTKRVLKWGENLSKQKKTERNISHENDWGEKSKNWGLGQSMGANKMYHQ